MNEETRKWAMFLHLSVFAGYVVPLAGFIAPIVIWQLKKKEMPELDAHGKVVVNFLISMIIYSVIAGILTLLLIGFLLIAVLVIVGVAFPIIGGIKANNGELWPYPGMIPFFK
jgi:uncharacterized Tic20 family protein